MEQTWPAWLSGFGHDTYAYPAWITAQMSTDCQRKTATHTTAKNNRLHWCTAKMWLLKHMPEFDRAFLPPPVSVNATSMLDDTIAFALMADRAAPWAAELPLDAKLRYILPYAGVHEARQNWRPLLFAKFFAVVANATSVSEAMGRLVDPNVFTQWSAHQWADSPLADDADRLIIRWSSSTSPPVLAPLDFAAYGYGSCSAWATLLAYTARAVGIPARQVGTPCWNSVYQGVDFRGRAASNQNVSLCWAGGSSTLGHGGRFLNNHNWVEYFDGKSWNFVNVPPATKQPDAGLCGAFAPNTGCGFNASQPAGHECDALTGGPGLAMQDHEIFAPTWTFPGESAADGIDGGEVLDATHLKLTDGSLVSPFPWASSHVSPLGERLEVRLVNRTSFYRCKPSAAPVTAEPTSAPASVPASVPAAAATDTTRLPAPFSRHLVLGDSGIDVTIMQHLLRRAPAPCSLAPHTEMLPAAFDAATGRSLRCLTGSATLNSTRAAERLLELEADGWKDEGARAGLMGYKYKLVLPTYRNRSIESDAALLDANNRLLLRFRARLHGHDVDASGQQIDRAWPDFSDVGCPDGAAAGGCVGLNTLSTDGNTPTGLYEVDLVAPEGDARLYGPYPITRLVRGLEGNAKWLVPHVRSGLLLHTGAWAQSTAHWMPSEPMPNSAGCVHAHPSDVAQIAKVLHDVCNVEIRPNTGSGLPPYPYVPQGLAAVFEINGQADAAAYDAWLAAAAAA